MVLQLKSLKRRRLRFPLLSLLVFFPFHNYVTLKELFLQFFPSDKAENDKFTDIVQNRASKKYFPSFKVSEMVGLSGRAVAKITSSFMVITSDNQKTNLGLSLKFEAKALKVIDYSRKDQRHWEFSEKAIDLIREYKANFPEIFMSLDGSGDGALVGFPSSGRACTESLDSNGQGVRHPACSRSRRPCEGGQGLAQVQGRAGL